MQVIPYVTETKDVRVIDSKIGKVMPIADIAKALDYNRQSLHDMINRSPELFEGTVVTVTLTTVQNNRGTEQKRDYQYTALNHYGVFGLLMKLDYNRIQDEAKKANVIRFQRWAMETLGNVASGTSARKATKVSTSYTGSKRGDRGIYQCFLSQLDEAPVGVETYSKNETCELLGKSQRTLYRYREEGVLAVYKKRNTRNKWMHAYLKHDIDEIVRLRKSKPEVKESK